MAVVALPALDFAVAGLAAAYATEASPPSSSASSSPCRASPDSFATVAAVDPSRKAAVLSGGTSWATASSAVGLDGGVLAIVLRVVANARRRRRRHGETASSSTSKRRWALGGIEPTARLP